MHCRAPSPGHQHGVTIDATGRARNRHAVIAQRHGVDRLYPILAIGGGDGLSEGDFDTFLAGQLGHNSRHFCPCIQNRNFNTFTSECDGGAVCRVVAGKNHGALSRLNPVTPYVVVSRARQHRAGAVIVAEHQGTFDGARRQHDLFGPKAPEALAWHFYPARRLGGR